MRRKVFRSITFGLLVSLSLGLGAISVINLQDPPVMVTITLTK